MKLIKTNEKIENQLKLWKNARKDLNDRKKMLDLCMQNMDDALNFKNSTLNATKLVNMLNKIKLLSEENPLVKKEQLKKMTKYKKQVFNEIIERLKMLGEIYDPYLELKNEGKYLRVI